jgi:predicted aldo/keto reductase-like oxidoreductase
MQFTGYSFNKKPLANLSIGCMRFPNRESAVEVIAECVKNDVLFLDTSPGYCFHSEEENDETWVGTAIKGIRDKVILSAKCSAGNGGEGVGGDFDPAHGFNIVTAHQVRSEIEQSLKRLNVGYFDVYSLWAVHSMRIYEEAHKKGGWLEGVLKAKEEGLIKHIGLTGHINNEEFIKVMDDGLWEIITLPFYMLDSSRLGAVKHAKEKGIAVIAMNPLAGGFLSSQGSAVIDSFLKKHNANSLSEIALRFCNAFGTSALSGMQNKKQVDENCKSVELPILSEEKALAIQADFLKLLANHDSFECTGCGYCMPCPQKINIPEVLKNRNHYKVLGIEEARQRLLHWHNWNEGFKLDNCTACKECESKCPNSVKVTSLFEEIKTY